jgi:hypothetical protein
MKIESDSQRLRNEFGQPEIPDGWTVLSEAEGNGNYGYGSRDLLMYLRGPDGFVYCQESSCCSCNGLEGSFEPIETNLATIARDLESYEKSGFCGDGEKARAAREAIAILSPEVEKAKESAPAKRTPEEREALEEAAKVVEAWLDEQVRRSRSPLVNFRLAQQELARRIRDMSRPK